MTLSAPALLTYSYFPLTGPSVAAGREQLDLLWRHLAGELGFDAPIDTLDVPMALPLPHDPLSGNRSRLLAARQRLAQEVWQAYVRIEHDVLCLAVMMAPPRTSSPAQTWARLEASLPPASDAALGESRLFLALGTGDADTMAAAVRTAGPHPSAVNWSRCYDELVLDGAPGAIWELGASDDDRALRRLVVVAPPAQELAIDRLVWTVGNGELTPLARYLLHAAKLRYQIRVFQAEPIRAQTSDRLDVLEEELLAADRPETSVELAKALRTTNLVRSRLARMRRGVDSIIGNLRNALGTYPRHLPAGPITDDLALADWFTGRLADESAHLDAAHARARSILGTPCAPFPTGPASPVPVGPARGGAPLVFISYIHDTAEHKEAVLRLADFLRQHGIDAQLDRYFTGMRQDWYRWVLELIRRADFVIVVASRLCRSIGDGQMSDGMNLGGQSEMTLLRELLHQDRPTWTRKLIPVVLPGHDWREIPLFLQPSTADHYLVKDFTATGAKPLLDVFTGRHPHSPPPLGVLPPSN